MFPTRSCTAAATPVAEGRGADDDVGGADVSLCHVWWWSITIAIAIANADAVVVLCWWHLAMDRADQPANVTVAAAPLT